jgi:hypothetical protein
MQPGGILDAASCWALSRASHQARGGHRIKRPRTNTSHFFREVLQACHFFTPASEISQWFLQPGRHG